MVLGIKRSTLAKINKTASTYLDILSPNEDNVQAILDWVMPDLDPTELKKSLAYYYKYLETGDKRYVPYFDPVPALFANYKFIQQHEKLAIHVGRRWWSLIEKYVGSPGYVLEMVGKKNPIIKKMLDTELGDSFIKYYTERLSTFFQAWFTHFPCWHVDCGGVIKYKLVNRNSNSWGFMCNRCGTPIAMEDFEKLTYMKRNYPEKLTSKK